MFLRRMYGTLSSEMPATSRRHTERYVTLLKRVNTLCTIPEEHIIFIHYNVDLIYHKLQSLLK